MELTTFSMYPSSHLQDAEASGEWELTGQERHVVAPIVGLNELAAHAVAVTAPIVATYEPAGLD